MGCPSVLDGQNQGPNEGRLYDVGCTTPIPAPQLCCCVIPEKTNLPHHETHGAASWEARDGAVDGRAVVEVLCIGLNRPLADFTGWRGLREGKFRKHWQY